MKNAFKSAEDINLISTGNLPYLHACIQETFRMHPPVPLALPRVTPKEGAMVNNIFVPGNTRVSVTQYGSYRSASNFSEPDTFDPDRWLPNPPEKYKNDNLDVLQPFSTGPRNCIGKK